MAVRGDSPSKTTKSERMSILAPLQNSPSARKRGIDHEELSSNKENEATPPSAKKATIQQAPLSPTPSKRPPFPLKPKPTVQQNSSHGTLSRLNPFASEFVFRPPLSAPKLASVPKEFSPINLQQSSKSLFNVFAPEFNPRPSGGGTTTLRPEPIFAKPALPTIFVKPSPRKKIIPIVPPVEGKRQRLASNNSAAESDGQRMGSASSTAKELPNEDERDSTEDELPRDGDAPAEGSEYFDVDAAEFKRTSIVGDIYWGSSDDAQELKALESESEQESNESEQESNDNSDGRAKKRPTAYNLFAEESDSPVTKLDSPSQPAAVSVPAFPHLGRSKTPVSVASSSKQSPEKEEFHGYPSFWEQRLSQSEEKARRDRPLIPRGKVARNLSMEFVANHDSEATESEDVSDKENRVLPDMDDYSESDSSQSILEKKSRLYERRRFSSSRMETVVRERLVPVMKVLEAVHADVQKLHAREQMKDEEASDADDEDEEIDLVKKPRLLAHERIKVAVIEALKQEKDLFAVAYPAAPDRSAEVKDLKTIIDNLKSKLLDSESQFDREERRRKELERQNDLLTRDLTDVEQNFESKSVQLKALEKEVKDLRNRNDGMNRELANERHGVEKLNEVIHGIRDSLGLMTDKNAKLTVELGKAQSLATSQRDDISDLREDISKARGETGKLSRERNKLEQDLKDERARFTNLQNELMETGRAIAEQETRWREELTAEKLRVQSLERSVADEERRFTKMEEECERLGLIAEERGKLKAMIEASVARERTLEGAKEKLEKRVHVAEARVNVILEEQTRREQGTAVHIEKEKEEMKEELASLKATVKVLKEERTKVHHQLDRERTSLAVQTEKVNALERDLKQAANTHTERQALLESTTDDLRESQSTVRDLHKDVIALRTKLEKRDEQVESLRTTIDSLRAEIVEKDKHITDLEFIIASTPSPTKKSRDEDLHLKLQKREKEILRIRELMVSLLHDNEDLLAQTKENLVPEQQKKYNAMKNVLRAERERRKNVERELVRMQAKASLRGNEMGVTPGGSRSASFFETPASGVRGLDTPVSLNYTPGSLRGFEDTPLKGKGVFVE